MRRIFILAAIATATVAGLAPAPVRAVPPDVVLILSDGQRADTLDLMPQVQGDLVAHGVTFTKGFASNPLCCPARASILTGTYSHTNGVWGNQGEFGGVEAFDDSTTIATALHDSGYDTAYFGKYLNGYAGTDMFTPPGWDRWLAFAGGRPGYYDYTLVDEAGALTQYGTGSADYSTDVLANQAEAFIRSADGPIFLHLSLFAPHTPAIAAPDDLHDHDGFTPAWDESFNETDVGDKPPYIQALRTFSPARIERTRAKAEKQVESLGAVDRGVGRIVQALDDTGRLENTIIIYLSDNGFAWGEHRWVTKEVPYEESIRVPLVVRYDPMTSGTTDNNNLVVNVDLAPTIAELTGTTMPGADGASLVPLLTGQPVEWRTHFPIEHWAVGPDKAPTYCGVRNQRRVYVRYADGFEELYNLTIDPMQLHNRAGAPASATTLALLRDQARIVCDPLPPGMGPF